MPNDNYDDRNFRHIESHLKRTYNEIKENAGTFKPCNRDRESNIFISLCRRMIKTPIEISVKDYLSEIELLLVPVGNNEININLCKEKLNEVLPLIREKIEEISTRFNKLSFNNKYTVNNYDDIRNVKNRIINLNYGDSIDFASVNSCYNKLSSFIQDLETEIQKEISFYNGKTSEMSYMNYAHYWTFGFVHRIVWNSCFYKEKAANYVTFLNTAIIPLRARIREHKDELKNVEKFFNIIVNKIDDLKKKVDDNKITLSDINTFNTNTNSKFAEMHTILNI